MSRKKRNRVDLSTAELTYAVREIERGHVLMKELAEELQVKPAVIYRIKQKCKKEPDYLQNLQAEEASRQHTLRCSLSVIEEKKKNKKPIWTADQVKSDIFAAHGVAVSSSLVRSLMKN